MRLLAIASGLVALLVLSGCNESPAGSAGDEALRSADPDASAEAAAQVVFQQPADGKPVVDVHLSPYCGCCGDWVEHIEAAGFTARVHLEQDPAAVRRRLGVPEVLGSCHTAVVDGYLIEGHVPAADIERLLEERPSAKGLAVPAMPIGSPGMEMGNRRDAYDVLLFDSERARVFTHYPGS